MKRFTFKKKLIAGAAAAALVVGVAGGAYAFWTTSGTGSGTATGGTLSAVTITGTVSTDLFLNVANTMSLDINNTGNNSPVTLNGDTLSITAATCNGTSVDPTWFSSGTVTETNEVAAATDTPAAATAPITLNDVVGVDQNACQGHAIVLTLSAA
jgi:hypothetical protein